MKTLLFIIASTLCCKSALLQPWNAKIMLHSVNGEIDTLWIGCDENGGWGYQPGLDEIDTNLTYPGIWGYDSLIAEGECLNLKKDVKEFITGIQKFNIQITDSFSQGGIFDYITIDSNEFKFDNGFFKITSLYIKVTEGGYIKCIDCEDWYIYYGIDTLNPEYAYFTLDSLSLIFEYDLFNCLPIDNYQMRLKLEVGFNYYLTTEVTDINRDNSIPFPNPAHDKVRIENSLMYKRIELLDESGRILLSKKPDNAATQIYLSNLPQGIYFFRMFPQRDSEPAFNYKILIF